MINKQALGNKIKALRESANLSQEDLSQKIGLSRVAISQIEQGNRSVDFLELAKISEVFKLKTDYFLIEDELINIELTENQKKVNNKISNFDPKKLKNVILYILEKCAGKPNVGETVLYKLLYFIDFDNFEINNQPISGLDYVHLQYGPVPVASQYSPVIGAMKANQELKIIIFDYFGLKIKRYINLIRYNIDVLCPKETKVIDDVIGSLSNMSAAQIEEYSHGDAPWQLTGDKEVIPYNLVFERKTPYAKRSIDDLRYYKMTGAKDVLNQLGSISKKEYDYYENL
jgi:transcriptional regulator with XRE-family HTH domain